MDFIFPDRFRGHVRTLDNSPLQAGGSIFGWHSALIGSSGEPLGGGTSASLDLSQRIALAESLEKLEVLVGLSPTERLKFKTEKFPTRCGFAVGFDEGQTTCRSIAEAVERWCWSKWIDEGFKMTEIRIPTVTRLATFFLSQFDGMKFFEKEIAHDIAGFPKIVKFNAVVGFKGGGAFPGSRVCSLSEDPWEHSILEAWRNIQIYESLNQRSGIYPFYVDRLAYFASHASVAIEALNASVIEDWPEPKLELREKLNRASDGYFLTRSLCMDYRPWHEGPRSRFVF